MKKAERSQPWPCPPLKLSAGGVAGDEWWVGGGDVTRCAPRWWWGRGRGHARCRICTSPRPWPWLLPGRGPVPRLLLEGVASSWGAECERVTRRSAARVGEGGPAPFIQVALATGKVLSDLYYEKGWPLTFAKAKAVWKVQPNVHNTSAI